MPPTENRGVFDVGGARALTSPFRLELLRIVQPHLVESVVPPIERLENWAVVVVRLHPARERVQEILVKGCCKELADR